jgi:methyl-accepting chemotaxis protein
MERRGLMRALETSQNLLWFDATGRIVDANEKVLALLGYSSADLLRRDFFDLTLDNPNNLLSQKRIWNRICSGEHVHSEMNFRARDGADVWTSVSFAALRHDNGETRRVLAILIDLSRWAWKPSSGPRIAR